MMADNRKFTLTIECENDALVDNDVHINATEIAFLLSQAGGKIGLDYFQLQVGDHEPVQDLNGNTVGEWRVI